MTHFTPAEAIRLMDEGGVDAAVIHPRALDSNSTALALEPVWDYPRRFAIMGGHDLLFQPPNGSSGSILRRIGLQRGVSAVLRVRRPSVPHPSSQRGSSSIRPIRVLASKYSSPDDEWRANRLS